MKTSRHIKWACLTTLYQNCFEKDLFAYIFIFTLLCGASKGFKKAFKAFIKPSEAPPRSVKIKI